MHALDRLPTFKNQAGIGRSPFWTSQNDIRICSIAPRFRPVKNLSRGPLIQPREIHTSFSLQLKNKKLARPSGGGSCELVLSASCGAMLTASKSTSAAACG